MGTPSVLVTNITHRPLEFNFGTARFVIPRGQSRLLLLTKQVQREISHGVLRKSILDGSITVENLPAWDAKADRRLCGVGWSTTSKVIERDQTFMVETWCPSDKGTVNIGFRVGLKYRVPVA